MAAHVYTGQFAGGSANGLLIIIFGLLFILEYFLPIFSYFVFSSFERNGKGKPTTGRYTAVARNDIFCAFY
jgi:hypothetical protein